MKKNKELSALRWRAKGMMLCNKLSKPTRNKMKRFASKAIRADAKQRKDEE